MLDGKPVITTTDKELTQLCNVYLTKASEMNNLEKARKKLYMTSFSVYCVGGCVL